MLDSPFGDGHPLSLPHKLGGGLVELVKQGPHLPESVTGVLLLPVCVCEAGVSDDLPERVPGHGLPHRHVHRVLPLLPVQLPVAGRRVAGHVEDGHADPQPVGGYHPGQPLLGPVSSDGILLGAGHQLVNKIIIQKEPVEVVGRVAAGWKWLQWRRRKILHCFPEGFWHATAPNCVCVTYSEMFMI